MSDAIAVGLFALGAFLINTGAELKGWKAIAVSVGVGLIAKAMWL